jgi:hypothetical protein
MNKNFMTKALNDKQTKEIKNKNFTEELTNLTKIKYG